MFKEFFESSIFLEIIENWLSYSLQFYKKFPILQAGWPAPAPLTPLTIKAVYVVSYSWYGQTSAPVCKIQKCYNCIDILQQIYYIPLFLITMQKGARRIHLQKHLKHRYLVISRVCVTDIKRSKYGFGATISVFNDTFKKNSHNPLCLAEATKRNIQNKEKIQRDPMERPVKFFISIDIVSRFPHSSASKL